MTGSMTRCRQSGRFIGGNGMLRSSIAIVTRILAEAWQIAVRYSGDDSMHIERLHLDPTSLSSGAWHK